MKKITILFTLIYLSLAQPFSAYSQQNSLDEFLSNKSLEHSVVALSVKEVETGKTVVSHNEKSSLVCASVLKLVTTSTALEVLGKDFRFSTGLYRDAKASDKLLIVGSGDPTLGSGVFGGDRESVLNIWANKIAAMPVPKNGWKLYIVDNAFGYEGVSKRWTWEDMGNYYATGSYGISFYDNSYRAFLNSSIKGSAPSVIKTYPVIEGLTLTSLLKTNSTGVDNAYIYGEPFSYNRKISGDIPGGRKSFSIRGDIPDPGLFLGNRLSKILESKGVKVESVSTDRKDYVALYDYSIGDTIHINYSRPLIDIVREINVKSNNHYAEHLIRAVGVKMLNDDRHEFIERTTKATADFWKKRLNNGNSLRMYDGSGLAQSNVVCPDFLCDILLYMHNRSENKDALISSLPRGGYEGTVERYFKDFDKQGVDIRLKSGSITGVQCYAGYITKQGKMYSFAIMVNSLNGNRRQVIKAIENFFITF